MSGDDQTLDAAGRSVVVSHPGRVVFEGIGATKLDLARYYLDVAKPLLAVTQDHPALLERFPEGAGGKSFFQKRVPGSAPSWLRTTVVATPNGTTSRALVVADIAHVLWAVNLGCLGLHMWPFRWDDPDHADELRIDLDPQPGVSFDEVREAAGFARSVLDELGIICYPKTSGSRGLHLYVRVEPRWTSVEVRAAAVALARLLERRHPELMTASWWKEERGRRVFVDFNQNAPHKTVFGPWSVRPRPGGQVSTPITWDELGHVNPDDLTIRSVPARLKAMGDPWAEMPVNSQSIEPLLELYREDLASGLQDAPWPPVYPKQPGEPPRVSPSRSRKT